MTRHRDRRPTVTPSRRAQPRRLLAPRARIAARLAPRLHVAAARPRDPAARHPDGARDGRWSRSSRVADIFWVVEARPRRGRDRRAHRVDADDHLCGRDGPRDGRDARSSRAASARRIPTAPRAPPCRRSRSASRWRSSSASSARSSRRALLAAMGASPAVVAIGAGFTRVMLGGSVDGPAAVPDQRHLPRRGRRGHRDAHAVARQRHQHRARPVPDLRAGAVPAARRHGRGRRDDDRPRHRRAVPAARARAGRGRLSRRRRHLRFDRATMRDDPAPVGHGHRSRCSSGRPAGSGWCGSSPPFGSAALAGYTHRDAHRHVRAPAVVGHGNAAATLVGQNLGARQPGARRAGGLARGALQLRLPRRRSACSSSLFGAADRARCSRPTRPSSPFGAQLPAHRQRRLPASTPTAW